jgi:hypothetical protein
MSWTHTDLKLCHPNINDITILSEKNSKKYVKVRKDVEGEDAKEMFPNRIQMRFLLV